MHLTLLEAKEDKTRRAIKTLAGSPSSRVRVASLEYFDKLFPGAPDAVEAALTSITPGDPGAVEAIRFLDKWGKAGDHIKAIEAVRNHLFHLGERGEIDTLLRRLRGE